MTILKLKPHQEKPCEWLNRMVNMADPGTRIIYGTNGAEENIMQCARDIGGVVFDGKNKRGKVNLIQKRDGENTIYMMEVI